MQDISLNQESISDTIEETKGNKGNQDSSQVSNDILNQSSLNGYIEKDSVTGKVEISSFSLSIKGLSTDHEQAIPFLLSEWRLILSLFKLFSEPIKIMIGNYKSSQEEMISKRKLLSVLK